MAARVPVPHSSGRRRVHPLKVIHANATGNTLDRTALKRHAEEWDEAQARAKKTQEALQQLQEAGEAEGAGNGLLFVHQHSVQCAYRI